MNEMYIISFNSTHQAIKCDKLFGKNEMDYTVLPTPREITQSCGMSIAFAIEDIDKTFGFVSHCFAFFNGVQKYAVHQ